MDIKLFSDLIDALGKVAGGLKAVINLPKAEREKYRQTFEETYRLIDTTLNMVIIRLGDILLPDAEAGLLQETASLDNYGEWMQAEREFRLCKSLRTALSETETLSAKLAGRVSARDWDALIEQMRSVLTGEREVGMYIAQQFLALADSARNTMVAGQPAAETRKQLVAFRDALVKERQQLIRQETELYEIV